MALSRTKKEVLKSFGMAAAAMLATVASTCLVAVGIAATMSKQQRPLLEVLQVIAILGYAIFSPWIVSAGIDFSARRRVRLSKHAPAPEKPMFERMADESAKIARLSAGKAGSFVIPFTIATAISLFLLKRMEFKFSLSGNLLRHFDGLAFLLTSYYLYGRPLKTHATQAIHSLYQVSKADMNQRNLSARRTAAIAASNKLAPPAPTV